MSKPVHIVVFRFSALGDVAMTVPVIKLLLQQHPQLQITYVSTVFVQPLFAGIDRLHFFAADLKVKHKGFFGLRLLKKEINKGKKIDAIADLHNVLRTKLLRTFFLLSVKKIAVIDKGRKEKAELTQKHGKKLRPLKSTFQRYADVFEKLGFSINLDQKFSPLLSLQFPITKPAGQRFIGVAPFAKHEEKMYPLEKMKEVVALLSNEKNTTIFLLGSKFEASILDQWTTEFEHVQSLAGKMSFDMELNYIAQFDVMLSMDSANMHLASLLGVPVVSVWGATHPFAGFYGWQQDAANAVQVDLYCRPCSVFGNRKCYRGDRACLHSIHPVAIYDRVVQQIYRQR